MDPSRDGLKGKQLSRFDRRHKWGDWTDEVDDPLWMRRTCAACGAYYRQWGPVAVVKAGEAFVAKQLIHAAKMHKILMSNEPLTLSGGGTIGWGFRRSEPKATAP